MTRAPAPPSLDPPDHRQHHRCLRVARVCAWLMTVAMVVVFGRVVQLQQRPAEPVARTAAARASESRLIARRGALVDRHGRRLAGSRVGYRLYVDPVSIDRPDVFAAKLARAIGDDAARIDRAIGNADRDCRYLVIDHLLDEHEADAVRRLKLMGVVLEQRLVRAYPAGPVAGQVIGFVSRDHRGIDGVEYVLDAALRGEDGSVEYMRDVRRRPVWIESGTQQPARDGRDIALSLDAVIQSTAEAELAAAAEHYRAKRAELIVMHAGSGQVLAMANWPSFDPNEGANVDAALRRNRCVTDPFEPGSIFKPIVFAAATGAGVAEPSEMIDCTDAGFYVSPGGRRLGDAHGHGRITWDGVLTFSSNIGMAIVGQRLGAERMYAAVRAFGMGQPSGVGLPGESSGIVNPLERWNHYSVTSVPMGQEIAVTPMQITRAFSAFANDGLMVAPSILAADADRPIYQRATDPATARHVRRVLRRVVTEGTGRHRANSRLYRLWGKTGTAQVPDRENGGYLDRAYTASFVCGAPLHHPQIIVTVVVHQPDPAIGYYGGTVAAPVARSVVEKTLAYLGTPPDATGPDEAPALQFASARQGE